MSRSKKKQTSKNRVSFSEAFDLKWFEPKCDRKVDISNVGIGELAKRNDWCKWDEYCSAFAEMFVRFVRRLLTHIFRWCVCVHACVRACICVYDWFFSHKSVCACWLFNNFFFDIIYIYVPNLVVGVWMLAFICKKPMDTAYTTSWENWCWKRKYETETSMLSPREQNPSNRQMSDE